LIFFVTFIIAVHARDKGQYIDDVHTEGVRLRWTYVFRGRGQRRPVRALCDA